MKKFFVSEEKSYIESATGVNFNNISNANLFYMKVLCTDFL